LRRQLDDTERLIEQRQAAFLAKYGTEMDDDNVWLQGRHTEATSLRQILLAVEDVTDNSRAVRGAGTNERTHAHDPSTEEDAG